MVGERAAARDPVAWQRLPNALGAPLLQVQELTVLGDRGEQAVRGLSLDVCAGEIVGVAGVSGNGQRELMQALTGQRARARDCLGRWPGLCRHARAEPPARGAQPAGGAAAKRLCR